MNQLQYKIEIAEVLIRTGLIEKTTLGSEAIEFRITDDGVTALELLENLMEDED